MRNEKMERIINIEDSVIKHCEINRALQYNGCIEKIQGEWIDDNVYLLDIIDQKTYAIEASSWANILGCRVDEKSLSDYGNEKFTTLILWEITWFGYDEKTIQDRLRSLFEDEDV